MKAIKILLILILPAIGFVGCKKSSCQPDHSISAQSEDKGQANKSTDDNSVPVISTESNPLTNDNLIQEDNGNAPVGGRLLGVEEDDENSTPVVGSGDDDRDGGDRKQKKAGR